VSHTVVQHAASDLRHDAQEEHGRHVHSLEGGHSEHGHAGGGGRSEHGHVGGGGHEEGAHGGIHLASWRWEEYSSHLMFTGNGIFLSDDFSSPGMESCPSRNF